jgi:hypothetical protein
MFLTDAIYTLKTAKEYSIHNTDFLAGPQTVLLATA